MPPGLGSSYEPCLALSDQQPENEESPETSMSSSISTSEESSNHAPEDQPVPEGQQPAEEPRDLETTPLTQALRLDPERLDGNPRHAFLNADKGRAFVCSRQQKQVAKCDKKYQKNTKKAGAGREVVYAKETPQVQQLMDAARLKEWTPTGSGFRRRSSWR